MDGQKRDSVRGIVPSQADCPDSSIGIECLSAKGVLILERKQLHHDCGLSAPFPSVAKGGLQPEVKTSELENRAHAPSLGIPPFPAVFGGVGEEKTGRMAASDLDEGHS